MGDGRNERTNLPHSGNQPDALSTLESAESYLAASAAASGKSNGGRKAFSASFTALLDWGETIGLIRPEADFLFSCGSQMDMEMNTKLGLRKL